MVFFNFPSSLSLLWIHFASFPLTKTVGEALRNHEYISLKIIASFYSKRFLPSRNAPWLSDSRFPLNSIHRSTSFLQFRGVNVEAKAMKWEKLKHIIDWISARECVDFLSVHAVPQRVVVITETVFLGSLAWNIFAVSWHLFWVTHERDGGEKYVRTFEHDFMSFVYNKLSIKTTLP